MISLKSGRKKVPFGTRFGKSIYPENRPSQSDKKIRYGSLSRLKESPWSAARHTSEEDAWMPWRRTGFWPHRRYIILVNSDADETGLTAEERKEKRISEAFPMILEFENWLQNTYLFKKSPILRKRRKGYDRVSLS